MSFASDILAKIGGNDEDATVDSWLDTGYPPLNEAISSFYDGGLPNGRIVEIFGDESCGKTAIATAAMIAAQRQGGVAAFFDHERSFDSALGESNGLDLSDRWIYKKPKTFEESISLAAGVMTAIRDRKVIPETAPIVCVFDSLAMMIPKSKLDKDMSDYGMHDTTALARATSAALPAFASFVEDTNTLAIFLNQMRQKPGVTFGDPNTTPGGKTMNFVASVRIQLSRAQIAKDGVVNGQTITAKIVKNKVSRPFRKVKWDFMFRDDGTGYLDSVGGTLDHLVDLGVVPKNGAYIEWDGKKLHRAKVIEQIEAAGGVATLLPLLPKPS